MGHGAPEGGGEVSTPRIDEDLTVIEHLDFEPECDRETCAGDARWVVAYHGDKCACVHEYLLCETCKNRAVEWAARPDRLVRCLTCGTSKQALTIDRIEPLR